MLSKLFPEGVTLESSEEAFNFLLKLGFGIHTSKAVYLRYPYLYIESIEDCSGDYRDIIGTNLYDGLPIELTLAQAKAKVFHRIISSLKEYR